MTPTVRYPAGTITPHGAYWLLSGKKPVVTYRSHDDNTVFNLMGGPSIPDRTAPEVIHVVDMKGLVPPWKAIEQKGATQDGSTFVDALYDPMEIDMEVEAVARNPAYARKLIRDWIEAWDIKEEGELSWFTHEMGRWWAPVRWRQTPVDKLMGGDWTRQKFGWSATAYDAFWRSYDCVDSFKYTYTAATDEFTGTYANGLGADWTILYTGGGSGIVYTGTGSGTYGEVRSTLIGTHTATCRRDYTSVGDNQVIDIRLGRFTQNWFHGTDTYVDVWARMNQSGTVGANGIRLRIGHRRLRLSYFIGGVETLLKERALTIPSKTGMRIVLVCGSPTDSRLYKVYRNGALLLTHKEVGTGSLLGASYRGAGFGLRADTTTLPPTVKAWAAGDNDSTNQYGFVGLTNVGDQPMWPRYTCFGPGTFTFAAAPGATDYVQFGPLLENQVMQIRTDPRKRMVIDMTSEPPPNYQGTGVFTKAVLDYLNFATANNAPQLLEQITSKFGSVTTFQGNPYSLLDGRFSEPIPPKPTGTAAPTHHIQVAIAGGDADSQIIAAGTPLRRWPQ